MRGVSSPIIPMPSIALRPLLAAVALTGPAFSAIALTRPSSPSRLPGAGAGGGDPAGGERQQRAAAAGYRQRFSIPNNQVRVIAAPLAGVVESLETAPGMNVKKGQVLVRISSPQALELQRDRLQADAQATFSRQTLARDEQLYREGLIAESRLQASRSNAAQSAAQAAERRQNRPLPSTAAARPCPLVAPSAAACWNST